MTKATPNAPEESLSEDQRLLHALEARRTGEPAPTNLPLTLPIASLRRLERLFQPRGMNEGHLSELGQAIKRYGFLEPLTILQIGADPFVIDGHHRHVAYHRAKVTLPVPVKYFIGDVRAAMIEAGAANSKAKLGMTIREKMDRAWRMVLIGGFTQPQIASAAGVSVRQVAIMGKVMRELGERAEDFDRWGPALNAHKGLTFTPRTEDEHTAWLERVATDYAERLHKEFGSQLTGNPEIAARALEHHFGQHLHAVLRELRPAHYAPLPGDEDGDADF